MLNIQYMYGLEQDLLLLPLSSLVFISIIQTARLQPPLHRAILEPEAKGKKCVQFSKYPLIYKNIYTFLNILLYYNQVKMLIKV